MKKINENYTSVCYDCGVIFKNNRSTAKFCSNSHRSLYGKYGARISPLAPSKDEQHFDADEFLSRVYRYDPIIDRDHWSMGYLASDFGELFFYDGPFPAGGVLLVVGSYVICKTEPWEDRVIQAAYAVKPWVRLTVEEKATGRFTSALDDKKVTAHSTSELEDDCDENI